jgi:hypothetical protein
MRKSISPLKSFLTSAPPPQLGKRLPDCPEDVFHCARSDELVAGGNSSIAVLLPKDLEDWNRVGPGAQKWVDSIFPMLVLCFGSLSSNSGFVLYLNKAEVSAKFISLQRLHNVQG